MGQAAVVGTRTVSSDGLSSCSGIVFGRRPLSLTWRHHIEEEEPSFSFRE